VDPYLVDWMLVFWSWTMTQAYAVSDLGGFMWMLQMAMAMSN
jgi:hypothetical protein